MSLLEDIQAAAISQTTDVPSLLRMCKLLAARISHQQLGEWVDRELNGYPNIDSLPDYRVVRVESYGSFAGPYSRANRLQVPVSILPESLQEEYSHAYMGNSISAFAAYIEGDKSGCLHEPWPLNLAIHHASKIMHDMQCVSAWKEIPIGAIVRLLDSVKTAVLGYAIDLAREAPDAGDTPIGGNPPLSREKMTQIFNTNISGNVSNVSNAGEGYTQTAITLVHSGNWDSLEKRLIELGLSPGDFAGLRTELDQATASANEQKKSDTASNWLGRLTGKAARGATGVGMEVAAAGIAKAITMYLGLPGA
ncbi:hypothetical protein [Castellaniella sp.]|uniref:AbiTii domain-containing protein n=1 Tax=Castellaniella sp. TaxID=1955812 RepID=UPI002AFFD834|nr:hypothetical protein [Castellaniella sp.]